MKTDSFDYQQAISQCKALAKSHYENFPIASLLIPKKYRNHFYAIYAFSRTADDLADESPSKEAAIKHLRNFKRQLNDCYNDKPEGFVFIALSKTIHEFALPIRLFQDLIDAFIQDQEVSRYSSWDEVMEYSRRSANPVGRLILHIFGYHSAEALFYSDAVCSALQLTNFWQDIWKDYIQRDRIYIPASEMLSSGYTEEALKEKSYSNNFVALMSNLNKRANNLFRSGKNLVPILKGRLRLEVILIILGGTLILEKLRKIEHNIFLNRPTITSGDKLKLLSKVFYYWLFPKAFIESSGSPDVY